MSDSATDKIQDILNPSQDTIVSATNPLARVWRILLNEIKPSPPRFYLLLSHYMEQIGHLIPKSKASNTKNNLVMRLANSEMTWAVLTRGLLIFDYDKVTVNFSFKSDQETITEKAELKTFITARNKRRLFSQEDMEYNLSTLKHCLESLKEKRLKQLNMTWADLVSQYAKRKYEDLLSNNAAESKTIHSIKAGTLRNLNSDNISWKSFEVAIDVMLFESFSINLLLDGYRNHVVDLDIIVNG